MQESFPRNARQGPFCPGCGGETLLSSQRPDMFECLECGLTTKPPEDDMRFEEGAEYAEPDELAARRLLGTRSRRGRG